jgi:hypothetical protein
VNYQILQGKTSLKKTGNGFPILWLKSFSKNWKDYILARSKNEIVLKLKEKKQ